MKQAEKVSGTVVPWTRVRFVLSPHVYDNEMDVVIDALKTEGYIVIAPDKTQG